MSVGGSQYVIDGQFGSITIHDLYTIPDRTVPLPELVKSWSLTIVGWVGGISHAGAVEIAEQFLLFRVDADYWMERTLLGLVVHMREYSPESQPNDSGLVLQAALDIPRGFGIAAWDSGNYAELRRSPEGLEFQRSLNFVPFDELEPAIRALLLPQVESLLLRLIQLAEPFGRLQ